MGYQWPDIVKHVQFIINRTRHSATGFAPGDILFGQINSLGYGSLTPMTKELLRRNQLDNTDCQEYGNERNLIEQDNQNNDNVNMNNSNSNE